MLEILNNFALLFGTGAFTGPVFWIVSLVLFVFWISQIIDCARREFPGSGKVIWMLIIIFLGWVGALIYLLVGKKQGSAIV